MWEEIEERVELPPTVLWLCARLGSSMLCPEEELAAESRWKNGILRSRSQTEENDLVL